MQGEKRVVFTRTPFRLSFVGGGTDIPEYYKNYGPGACVTGGMTKYTYVIVSEYFFENSIRARYTKMENDVTNVNEVQHPSIRESMKYLGITKGVQITSIADIPSKGTGLGSSSAFAVGLLNALHSYKGEKVSQKKLADEAIHIERDVLKEAGGKQDQYAAAMGGLMLMEFNKDDTLTVKKSKISKKDLSELEKHLLLLYTGKERTGLAGAIEAKKSQEFGSHTDALKRMAQLAHELFDALDNGRWQETGRMLHENWMLKKQLTAGVSNDYIDRLYNTGMKNGAEGGKLLGAGAGGFLMFFADPEKHQQIIDALPECKVEPLAFDMKGTQVIWEQGEPKK